MAERERKIKIRKVTEAQVMEGLVEGYCKELQGILKLGSIGRFCGE